MAKKSPIPDDAPTAASLPACFANVKPDARRLEAGDMLFRQGDKSFGMFRLATGRIRLLRSTPGGADMPMHTVRAGELFAEASLFSERYHCDAIALQRSEVLVYPKAALQHALRQDPDALWAFAAELAQRVQGLRTRLELSRIHSAPERVLQALRLRCDASGTWKPDATLKRFAEEIGLTHEALYRALAALEREGRIARRDEEFTLR
ncbi:Crp/Fnr family transcriptional regulator [Herbaspirillum sp. ST 5-3]|uniref:Crp/Fnr family transcriptional regulator n=1 Tax=Oxalobacteraceae TaxID=75682 RepID=UPI0010A4DE8D|nr:Crp/Fnr family transcriptional regulator [Herbaspirillum sp. ST 5-3]